MTGWSEGYVTEIGYIHGYYGELKPMLMRQALLAQAIDHRWPRELKYLELGFGQGLSLNIHAAATEGEFWGCDFNPTQAANAQAMATASGANLTILDASFEELANRNDLPTFDVIALHGIWSWISEANRRLIVDIARRHLAVGGVFYVSYNTTVGWSPVAPLRQLLSLHAKAAFGEALGIEARFKGALDFAQTLADGNAGYLRANPVVAAKLKRIRDLPINYSTHEYLTADWHPMSFADIAGDLVEAKLSFSASAHLLDHLDVLNLSPDQIKLLQVQRDPVLRETVRDFLVNQPFRRDLWIKGPRPLARSIRNELAARQLYILVTTPGAVPGKATGWIGEVELQQAVYRPVVDALAHEAFVPKSLTHLKAMLPQLPPDQVAEAVMVLSAMGHVLPAQDPDTVRSVKPACDRLNDYLFDQATHAADMQHLASPVLGGGIPVNRFQQFFLQALKGGRRTSAEWAEHVWKALSDQGQGLAKEGRVLESAEESLAELGRQAAEFETTRLPILRALQVI